MEIEGPLGGAIASHSRCDSGIYLVRESVWRAHLCESTMCGLPRPPERSSSPVRYRYGRRWDALIPFLHPDDQEESRRVWSTCLRTGSAGEVTFRARNAAEEGRWFLSRAEPLRASGGTLLYWVGVDLDIDEPRKAEFYLKEGQRLAHIGSWAFNPNGFDYRSSELFRIQGLDTAGEALRNAFRHAQARQIEVEIIYEERHFELIVRDDGKGLDPMILSKEERPGHWGLPGMRERAKLIGGRLEAWSKLESGTEIELTTPPPTPTRPLALLAGGGYLEIEG